MQTKPRASKIYAQISIFRTYFILSPLQAIQLLPAHQAATFCQSGLNTVGLFDQSTNSRRFSLHFIITLVEL